MKSNQTFWIVLIIMGTLSLVLGVYNHLRAQVYTEDVTLSNIEAFNTTQGLNCEYVRKPSKCTITVNAGVTVEIFGIGITNPKADGTISFDGQVTCAADGKEACTPIECFELYRLVAGN